MGMYRSKKNKGVLFDAAPRGLSLILCPFQCFCLVFLITISCPIDLLKLISRENLALEGHFSPPIVMFVRIAHPLLWSRLTLLSFRNPSMEVSGIRGP